MRKPFEGDYPLTQSFGVNPDAYVKFGLKGHNGLDYGLPLNTNIIAPITGKVVEVGWDATGYGLYMKIENEKEGCLLGHLTDNLLAVGADCEEGQLIAHSGNTGNSTGPHLHFGYYLIPRDRNNGYAGYIDPEPYLNPIYQENIKLKQEVQEYKDGLDTANEKIQRLEKQIEDLQKQLADKPQPQETPQVPAPVETTPEPQTTETNKKLDLILKFIEGLKRLIHITW